jgi:lipoyl(octanoyl) transferase
MHGFALNVNNDLSFFERINPCGITGCPMTSLGVFRGTPLDMEEVKSSIGRHFEELLDTWLPSEETRAHDEGKNTGLSAEAR